MNTAPPRKKFSDFKSKIPQSLAFEGPSVEVHQLFGVEITVHKFKIEPSKIKGMEHTKCLMLEITLDGRKRVVFSASNYLMTQLLERNIDEDFPFDTTIVRKENKSHQFT